MQNNEIDLEKKLFLDFMKGQLFPETFDKIKARTEKVEDFTLYSVGKIVMEVMHELVYRPEREKFIAFVKEEYGEEIANEWVKLVPLENFNPDVALDVLGKIIEQKQTPPDPKRKPVMIGVSPTSVIVEIDRPAIVRQHRGDL